jgi:glutathione S-transferase
MKLLVSATSPYARKCWALVIEKSLETRIAVAECPPMDDPAELHAVNPLGKVPALIRDRGPALFDSPVICEFIDTLDDERWIPSSGESRLMVLRQQAIAGGVLDLVMGRRIELNRDITLRWPFWAERWEKAIVRALDVMEAERCQFERSCDLGALSIAIALGYLDLRWHELDWRASHPGLAAFHARWAERDSFRLTEPPKG